MDNENHFAKYMQETKDGRIVIDWQTAYHGETERLEKKVLQLEHQLEAIAAAANMAEVQLILKDAQNAEDAD